MIRNLQSHMEKQGYKVRVVSLQYVSTLRQEINKWRRKKAICKELDERYLQEFDFNTPKKPFKAQSIIIVASPQPITRVSFMVKRKPITMIIPPTYCHSSDEKIEKLLLRILQPEGFQYTKAILPLKS